MPKPFVSILIPAHNAGKYLKACLDSALHQTYPFIEIVIVNDGSEDNTSDIIKEYRDERIKYFHQENRGIAKTRNRLFRESKGDYLTFLDSDDIYLSDKVKKEVEFLETHPDYSAVYCNLRYFFDGEPNKFFKHQYAFPSGDIFAELLKKQFITNTALMLRRAVVDKIGYFNENTREVEDWSYFLKMAKAGMLFGFIDEVLAYFRLRWDNNTRFDKQVKIQADAVDIFENLKQELSREEIEKYRLNRMIAKRKIRLAVILLAVGKKKEARGVAWSVMAILPRFSIVALVIVLSVFPVKVLKFAIEKSWNLKKKNLFIPI